jgi:RND family efflux transporter MFP subunit
MKIKIYVAILMCALLPGCTHSHTHTGEESNHASNSPAEASADDIDDRDSGNTTIFTREQQEKVPFDIETLRPQAFGPVIRTTAQIQATPGSERIIVAQTAGTVLFSNPSVVEGRAVKAGQPLFVIDGSGTAGNDLSVRYAEVESEYLRSKAEYERKRALSEDRIVSESELLKSRTELSAAEALFLHLKRNFPQGKQTVASPVGGYVTSVRVRNGQYAEPGQAVLSVGQNRDLLLRAEVPTRYFEALSGVRSAHVRVLDTDRTYTLEELNGQLLSYGRSTDVEQPLLPVVFRVDRRAGLLPGRFVELFIRTETDDRALTLPNEALVEEMGQFFVYVQLSPERFEKRAVVTGATDGIRTEIRSGATEGETVVARGAVFIKLAQAAGTVDVHSGHVH